MSDIYEPFTLEQKIKKVYELQQQHQDIGYCVVIEDVFDEIQLYQLAQTCYYLSRLVVLSYKKGLNQVLRAPGEFVCFFNLAREVIFAKTNYFYYSKNMDLKDSTKCDPIVHDVAKKEIDNQV